jgi:hypothetical protein
MCAPCVCHLQEFMQQLLTAIVEQFPHQALWSMAVVVKSTIRTRQVRGYYWCCSKGYCHMVQDDGHPCGSQFG